MNDTQKAAYTARTAAEALTSYVNNMRNPKACLDIAKDPYNFGMSVNVSDLQYGRIGMTTSVGVEMNVKIAFSDGNIAPTPQVKNAFEHAISAKMPEIMREVARLIDNSLSATRMVAQTQVGKLGEEIKMVPPHVPERM